jgi:hypothetical protein
MMTGIDWPASAFVARTRPTSFVTCRNGIGTQTVLHFETDVDDAGSWLMMTWIGWSTNDEDVVGEDDVGDDEPACCTFFTFDFLNNDFSSSHVILAKSRGLFAIFNFHELKLWI